MKLPRAARFTVENGTYHVMTRRINRNKIFLFLLFNLIIINRASSAIRIVDNKKQYLINTINEIINTYPQDEIYEKLNQIFQVSLGSESHGVVLGVDDPMRYLATTLMKTNNRILIWFKSDKYGFSGVFLLKKENNKYRIKCVKKAYLKCPESCRVSRFYKDYNPFDINNDGHPDYLIVTDQSRPDLIIEQIFIISEGDNCYKIFSFKSGGRLFNHMLERNPVIHSGKVIDNYLIIMRGINIAVVRHNLEKTSPFSSLRWHRIPEIKIYKVQNNELVLTYKVSNKVYQKMNDFIDWRINYYKSEDLSEYTDYQDRYLADKAKNILKLETKKQEFLSKFQIESLGEK